MTKQLKLTAALLAVSSIAFTADAGEKGFKKIFNGKDLSGWKGNTDLWSVKDGAITGVTKAEPKLTHNTFLVWQAGKLENFELRLQYRIEKGNSGIQYRSHVKDQGDFGPIVSGYQADFEAGTKYSGILYEEKGRGILALRGEKVEIDGMKEIKKGKRTRKVA
ncbi:MAG: 3-keto-disaccharide hydrolase, partial [Limisphaerales bacterium]